MRNCEGRSDARSLGFEWAPEVNQCPHAYVGADGWEVIAWWQEWTSLRILPYGGSDVLAQPAQVAQGILYCATISAEVQADREAKQAASVAKPPKGKKRGRRGS